MQFHDETKFQDQLLINVWQSSFVTFEFPANLAQSGNWLIPKMRSPVRLKVRRAMATLMMFMTNPMKIMSRIRMSDAAKTMALGGVATGSMKA